jgi:hypothetical protein
MIGYSMTIQNHWQILVLVSSTGLTRPCTDGVAENETEVSIFNRELYDTFKANPEVCSTLTSVAMI